jgi:hypothetical protein
MWDRARVGAKEEGRLATDRRRTACSAVGVHRSRVRAIALAVFPAAVAAIVGPALGVVLAACGTSTPEVGTSTPEVATSTSEGTTPAETPTATAETAVTTGQGRMNIRYDKSGEASRETEIEVTMDDGSTAYLPVDEDTMKEIWPDKTAAGVEVTIEEVDGELRVTGPAD